MGVEELFVGGMEKSRMHLHWNKKLFLAQFLPSARPHDALV